MLFMNPLEYASWSLCRRSASLIVILFPPPCADLFRREKFKSEP